MNQTWPFKDIDSRPTKGRFFPISFTEATFETNKWLAKDRYEKRVRICFLNHDDDEASDFLFAEYRPEEALILYSWPENMSALVAKQIVVKSFPIFAPLKRARVTGGGVNFAGCYLLRLLKTGQLRLTKCELYFQQRKFGGGRSFSTASKRRVTRVKESDLPIPSGSEAYLDEGVGA